MYKKKSESLYFGDLHIHTNFSDGTGTPEQNLRYARDVVGLDFAAVTDHAEDLTEEKWEKTIDTIREQHASGNFVTFLAFEWTHPSGLEVWPLLLEKKLALSEIDITRYGHRNVYYKRPKGRYFAWNEPQSDNPEKLWSQLEAQDVQALVIPHHPASYVFPVNWEIHTPKLERLVEIYSMWGSSEIPESEGNSRPIIRGGGEVAKEKRAHVQCALDRGYRVGIIAGSDGHDGYGGQTRHHIQNLSRHQGPFYPSGITGVYATNVSREAIWDALWNRRCYGTTGEKIKLRFSINGKPMGSTLVKDEASSLSVEAEIAGTADVQKVELICDGQVSRRAYGSSPQEIFRTKLSAGEVTNYSYIRVRQTNGGIAWSSPVWVG